MAVKIRIFAREAIERQEDMKKRMRDFRQVFNWAKRELEKANAENFATSGLPVGGWDPLDREYAQWKRTEQPAAKIMVGPDSSSGALMKSLTNLNGPPNRIYMKKAIFGTSIEYAKFHQYGTTKMAKRRLVYEPRFFRRDLTETMSDHIIYGRTDPR